MTGLHGIDVRPRTAADLPALTTLLAAQQSATRYPLRWPLPFPAERFVAREVDLAAWVAELDGRPVGHVSVQHLDDVFSPGELGQEWSRAHGRPAEHLGILGTLFVDPGVRRQGVGRLLHDTALAWLREHDLAPCLDVVPVHAAAVEMYARLGWVEVARVRPPWLPDAEPDVVAMVLPVS
jgi:GNAT superfamily N-acetyltransferase